MKKIKKKELRHKGKLKKIIKNDPELGKVYQSGYLNRPVLKDDVNQEPYNTRSARVDDDSDDSLSVIGAIAAVELIENIVEAAVDNTDYSSNNTPDTDFGGGDTGGGGAGSDY